MVKSYMMKAYIALKKADRQAAETSANNIFTPTPVELLIN